MPPLRLWASALVLSLLAFLPGCDRSPRKSPAAESAASRVFPDPAPVRRDANDAGRFLAGLPGTAGSPFAELESQDAWQAHRAAMDSEWSRIQAGMIPAINRFQSVELDVAAPKSQVVFYPFSGPDVLFITALFPRRPVYVMVGLEPPGTVPAPERLARKPLDRYLDDVRTSVYSELHRSFFITREMDRQFRGQLSDGLLPAILHLLVRTGHTIDGYRYVRLDAEGRVAARSPRNPSESRAGRDKGVEIDFHNDAEPAPRKLFYFSVNLSDEGLHRNEPFLRFLSKLGRVTTYLKATSYMTHRPEFSLIRRQVLDLSDAILQDDSGIPYRFFGSPDWRVQLFGSYDRPYGSFRWLEQPDLKKAYAAGAAKPLGFRIGYGFSRVPSNLLLAVRTGSSLSARR